MYVCMHACTYVQRCASLAPQRLDEFRSHSACKSLFITGRFPVNMNIQNRASLKWNSKYKMAIFSITARTVIFFRKLMVRAQKRNVNFVETGFPGGTGFHCSVFSNKLFHVSRILVCHVTAQTALFRMSVIFYSTLR